MKQLLFLLVLVVSCTAVAAMDPCPCGTHPPFRCCGDLECDRLVFNAAYIGGGMCYPRDAFFCCVNGSPGMYTQESADTPLYLWITQIRGQTEEPFDGLRNGVEVRLWAATDLDGAGVLVTVGRYAHGVIRWEGGQRHLHVAGDLFLVKG